MTNSQPRHGAGRRTLPLALAVAVLLCIVFGVESLPRLRGERQRLLRLQGHMEEAAAPGEPLLVDDRWIFLAMRWAGSRAYPGRAVRVPEDGGPSNVFHQREVVLVAHPEDPLVKALRASGYALTAETSDGEAPAWDPSGNGSGLYGHAGVRIFFVLPPAARTTPAEVPSKP